MDLRCVYVTVPMVSWIFPGYAGFFPWDPGFFPWYAGFSPDYKHYKGILLDFPKVTSNLPGMLDFSQANHQLNNKKSNINGFDFS